MNSAMICGLALLVERQHRLLTALQATRPVTQEQDEELTRLFDEAIPMIAGAESYLQTPEARMLDAIMHELAFARSKFPGNELTAVALAEEFGETMKALLDEPWANVVKEATQLATMSLRLAIEGDASVIAKRQRKGLDQRPAEMPTHFTVNPLMEDGMRFVFLVNAILEDGPTLQRIQERDVETLDDLRKAVDAVRRE